MWIFNSGQLQNNLKLGQNFSAYYASAIILKNNITQTDHHNELFQSCSYDRNQNRNTIGFQTFDTGPFLLSLQETNKKIPKALMIILLHFLTLSRLVVTKGHTYLNKPAAETWRFV